MKTKLYGNMEGIALQRHSPTIPSGFCAIGVQGELWWIGSIREAKGRSKNFPKADKVFFHKLDEELMNESFK